MKTPIEGLPRLRVAILKAGDAVTKAAVREVKRSALNVESGAKLRSPVDTGRLRGSITHDLSESGLGAVIGTNVEYSPYVEFGTERQRAQPYLLPALEEERPRFYARLRAAVGAALVRGID